MIEAEKYYQIFGEKRTMLRLNRITNSKITFKKDTIEWWSICLLLIFSFVNTTTLLTALLLLLFLFNQKEIGALKILNIITLRTLINPGVAVSIESLQNLKWAIIFMCSIYLIFGYGRIEPSFKKELKKILLAIIAFAVYNLFTSFFFSTLPTIAIFKLFSYVVVFLGVMIGIANTHYRFNWINWLHRMMATIMMFSIPLITLPIGYLRNGHAFQGMTNQPNMFGIIATLFITLVLTKLQLGRVNNPLITYLGIGIMLYMIILSKSRTSFITSVFLFLLYFILLKIGSVKQVMAFSLMSITTTLYLLLDKEILQSIQVFLYKGQEDILYSRLSQVEGLMFNFLNNPWFGSGFAVPVTPFRSFSFTTEYVVEPGNLILAVLSYSGIIGFGFFIFYIFKIFQVSRYNYKCSIFLFISPLLISMGEMVFFSSNNIGNWCYMLLGLSMVLSAKALKKQQVQIAISSGQRGLNPRPCKVIISGQF